ncbi:hypothetical protein [Paraburkholderia rhynchosiae]|uniref:DUF1440 domain-containing protein n=1 Tax=Paraburkholderia rhynchosiae TaxID=487049 RepID=A0A2N7WKK4_9BURK|nr:hypothetical protein [Paraburkholderia rhynchosiae]PMS29932.1 hypothetical protein C0Z16_15895 [Paraburkholderia rhynchosiae]CAB3695864.1 hypothetical protein LMG27174_03413 [Paraburkholderia rhynchosiae]
MNRLANLVCRAMMSGTAAGAAAAITAGARARNDGSTPYAPLNAVTHCLWPRRAFSETGLSARFTLTGLAIHQASAIFWGVLFEGLLDRWQCHMRRPPGIAEVVASAGTTAAVAYVVDYHAVPERLTPGFEAHLSGRSMFYVYAALAAGFAAAALYRGRRER